MSNSLLNTVVKAFSWVLMGISVVIAVLFFTNTVNEELFIFWAYILTIIAALLAVVFPVIFFAVYPKNAIKALAGLAVLGVVFFAGYLMADTTPIVAAVMHPDFTNPSVLQFADTGIIATYILFGIAVVSLLFTGIRSLFNR